MHETGEILFHMQIRVPLRTANSFLKQSFLQTKLKLKIFVCKIKV
jgi:hypothetical protein